MTSSSTRHVTDPKISGYNGEANDYDLTKDPRCLWGWGPPTRDCRHRFGHFCCRELGHPGECWDGGELRPTSDRMRCDTARRPRAWDATGRAEANR